ncbi:MAG: pyroglutamyl-peptidase I [Bacteroidales bacterium]|nr:pyroglutamyl-peptidase I [Bacteroidales bacterium]
MRVLLTGFEPFGGDAINSSQETVRAVTCDEFGDIEVVTDILPVSFNRVEKALCRLIDENDPDVVIMLGQSGLSNCIKIERVAVNLMDSANGDNDGYTPDEETIYPDAPPAYFTQLPVKKLRDCLIQAGIPAKTSSSAGLYVCNRTYFAALHHIASTGRNTKAVFIHLPEISDEWPVEKLKKAIKISIEQ